MKRFIMNELIKWKNSEDRKPLIVRGARQVGKTTIVRQFAKANYKNFVEIMKMLLILTLITILYLKIYF